LYNRRKADPLNRLLNQYMNKKIFLVLLYFTAILIIALAIRISFIDRAGCIEVDGAEYARLAENLISGKGFVGLDENPHLGLSPLYPILVSGLTFINKNSELSGRLISLIFGLGSLLPIYLLAKMLFNRRTALLSLFLAAVYPLTILSSTAVLSESAYTFFFTWNLYLLIIIISNRELRWAPFLGLTLGLAYLIRPEAYLFLGLYLIILIIHFIRTHEEKKRLFTNLLLMILVFVFCALPYMMYIYKHTGRVAIEGKSSVGLLYMVNAGRGQDYHQIMYKLNHDFSQPGLLINRGWTIQEGDISFVNLLKDHRRELIRSWARNLVNSRKWLLFRVYNPLIWIAIVVGLLLSLKNRKHLIGLIFLLLHCFLIFALIISYLHQFRFYIPSAPLVLILLSFSIWTIAEVLFKIVKDNYRRERVSTLFVVLLTGFFIILAIPIYRNSYTYSESQNVLARRAGEYILASEGPGRKMMSVHPVAAYYAQAVFIPTPYASWNIVKDYAHNEKVDIFGVNIEKLESRKLINGNFRNYENPDNDLRLAKMFSDDSGNKYLLYKLNN